MDTEVNEFVLQLAALAGKCNTSPKILNMQKITDSVVELMRDLLGFETAVVTRNINVSRIDYCKGKYFFKATITCIGSIYVESNYVWEDAIASILSELQNCGYASETAIWNLAGLLYV